MLLPHTFRLPFGLWVFGCSCTSPHAPLFAGCTPYYLFHSTYFLLCRCLLVCLLLLFLLPELLSLLSFPHFHVFLHSIMPLASTTASRADIPCSSLYTAYTFHTFMEHIHWFSTAFITSTSCFVTYAAFIGLSKLLHCRTAINRNGYSCIIIFRFQRGFRSVSICVTKNTWLQMELTGQLKLVNYV